MGARARGSDVDDTCLVLEYGPDVLCMPRAEGAMADLCWKEAATDFHCNQCLQALCWLALGGTGRH